MPESLRQIPHEDSTIHVYLEVYNKEQARWMTVDATWDRGLASRLPVSEWDGRSDTTLAVKPTESLKPIESQEEFDKLFADNHDGEFGEALNKWLESIRT